MELPLQLPFPERQVLTVSDLTAQIKAHLESAFQGLWVEGEVSNLRAPSSGHVYFTLKDEGAQIKAVLFRGRARHVRFQLEEGLKVQVLGGLDVYGPRGEYQLVVEFVEPVGLGALQLAFEQLKARLSAEGLFDQSHKRPLPVLPRKIGVITSPTGAAIRDILRILGRRFANLHVLIFPVRVQGEEAPGEIVRAVQEMNRIDDLDVLILTRGGGSLEDLWAFNDEAVVRAIFASRIPIISAVGHETDYTIADFVADVRAPTPSGAAEMVIQEKETLLRHLRQLSDRLGVSLGQRMTFLRHRVQQLAERRVIRDPTRAIRDHQRRLDDLTQRLALALRARRHQVIQRAEGLKNRLRLATPFANILNRIKILEQLRGRLVAGVGRALEGQHARFRQGVARLEALSPVAVLARGYSITRRLATGAILRDAGEVSSGEAVAVRLLRGQLTCRVERIEE